MDQILRFFQSYHDDDILYADLQVLNVWLVIDPSSTFFIVSTVLFHKDRGSNIVVTDYMSHFSMFTPTKANVKFSNGDMVNSQVIGIILCCFLNWPIIYPVVPVYYCLGQP